MELTKDTQTVEHEKAHQKDAQQTGSGSAQSPGGAAAPTQTTSEMSHGGEAYPGPRAGGESEKTQASQTGGKTP